MTDATWRVKAFAAVVACFFLQGALVYTDAGSNPGSTTPLSPVAREGEALFRANGCQSCHQLFGMGGFLGPDLTNAARRVPPARFAEVLQYGTPTMPAFHLDQAQRGAILAYLEAIDATGRGTPPAPAGERGPLFAAGLQRWESSGREVPEEVRAGVRLVASRQCGTCHLSFAPAGAQRAPDLSLAVLHLGESGVHAVLRHGRGAMPAALLDSAEAASVVALLRWVGEHRDALAPLDALPLDRIPWYAYPSQASAGELAPLALPDSTNPEKP